MFWEIADNSKQQINKFLDWSVEAIEITLDKLILLKLFGDFFWVISIEVYGASIKLISC